MCCTKPFWSVLNPTLVSCNVVVPPSHHWTVAARPILSTPDVSECKEVWKNSCSRKLYFNPYFSRICCHYSFFWPQNLKTCVLELCSCTKSVALYFLREPGKVNTSVVDHVVEQRFAGFQELVSRPNTAEYSDAIFSCWWEASDYGMFVSFGHQASLALNSLCSNLVFECFVSRDHQVLVEWESTLVLNNHVTCVCIYHWLLVRYCSNPVHWGLGTDERHTHKLLSCVWFRWILFFSEKRVAFHWKMGETERARFRQEIPFFPGFHVNWLSAVAI